MMESAMFILSTYLHLFRLDMQHAQISKNHPRKFLSDKKFSGNNMHLVSTMVEKRREALKNVSREEC